MTWTGYEVEVARPPDPAASIVIGGRLITITGRNTTLETTLIPLSSSYVITDLSSGAERVFTGIQGYRKNEWSLVAAQGRAWVFGGNSGLVGGQTMQGIDPIGGGIIAPGGRSTQNMSSPPASAGGYLFDPGSTAARRYDTIAGEWTSLTGLRASWLFTIGDRLFLVNNVDNITVEIDPSTANTLNTWPGHGPGTTSAGRQHVVFAGRVHVLVSDGIHTFEPATGWAAPTGYTPTGRPSLSGRPVADESGYLYQLVSNSELAVTDPTSGRWAIRDLPTTRGRRGGMYFANGTIRIPSGEPVI